MFSKASLNHVYRTVWNQSLGAMVAVAEISAGRGRSPSSGVSGGAHAPSVPAWGLTAVALGIAVAWGALPAVAFANPAGGVALVGQATMTGSGSNLLVVTQNGAGLNHSAIDWQSFSVPKGNSTYFQQPNAASTVINRVVTNTPSQLFGTLGSNGNLVLVNQSGITVGAGAVVDTAGFTASALHMTDADAVAGRQRFGAAGVPGGGVSAQGKVLARSGDVVLIGANVSTGSDALIEAPNGTVALAAGGAVSIGARGLEGITLEVQAPTDSAVNLGTLRGNAAGIFAGTLKHSGMIQATTATQEGGRVVLKAAGDAFVEGAGQILAAGNRGGNVDVLGNRVAVADQAVIDASGELGGGTVRVGGDYLGQNASVKNASRTYFGPQASIVADATVAGTGGKVIVWADETTRAYGQISAKGGVQAGDGGFVETSGKEYLDVGAIRVDTRGRSLNVNNGTWLLDPAGIEIIAGSSLNVSGGPNFTEAGSPSQLSVTTLLGSLNTTAVSVVGVSGVTVSTPIDDSSNANKNNLTLKASSGSVTVNQTITLTNRDLLLEAVGGSIALNAGLSVGSGNVTLTGDGVSQTSTAPVLANKLTVTSNFNSNVVLDQSANNVATLEVSAGTGQVSYWDTNGFAVGPISSGALSLKSSNNGAITQAGVIAIASGSAALTLDTGSGNVTLGNTGNNLNTVIVTSGGSVDVSNNSTAVSLNGINAGSFKLAAGGNVTWSGNIVTSSGAIDIASGGVFSAEGTSSMNSAGAITVRSTGNLTFNSVTKNLTSSGDIRLGVGSGATLDATNANILGMGGGRWFTYLTNPLAGHSFGTSFDDVNVGFKQYGAAFGASPLGAGNGRMYTDSPNLSGALGGSVTKAYDGGTSVSMSGANFSVAPTGAIDSDDVSAALTLSGGTGTLASANVGSGISVSGSGMAVTGVTRLFGSNVRQVYGYTGSGSGLIGSVTPAPVVATPVSAALTGLSSKPYDGTTTATLTPTNFQLTGFVGSDSASVTKTTGTYASKNVGTDIAVSTSLLTTDFSPAGSTLLSNYALPTLAVGNIGVITPKALTLTGTPVNKVYDGTTVANLNPSNLQLSGFAATEGASVLRASGNYATKNVGKDIAVNVTLLPADVSLNGGALLSNYALPSGATSVTGSITPKPLALSATALNKVYDGTTTATVNDFGLSGFVAGERVGAVSAAADFDTKDVGQGKTVAISGITLVNGTGLASNYSTVSATSALADITPAPLSANAILASLSGAVSKVYDGTTKATLTPSNFQLSGFVGSDSANVTQTVGTYSTKNVGTAISVSAALEPTHFAAVGGTVLSNYTLPKVATGNVGTITQRPLSTWTGAVSSAWSAPGNWDAVPDGVNVAAVSIPAGSGSVVFDAGVGNTVLQALNSNRPLVIRDGALQISSSLSTSGYSQTGGSVTGAGSFTVNGSFSQTGGGLSASSIDVTQTSGNLTFNGLIAPTVTLRAINGAITQSGGVVADNLSTTSTTGTVLNGPGNRVRNWRGSNTGSGSIEWTNLGVVNVQGVANSGGNIVVSNTGGITTSGSVSAPAGSITFTANSPLTIGAGGVSASGNVVLAATNLTSKGDMTLNGAINSSAGSVTLDAANDLTQNATVFGALGVTAKVGGALILAPGATTGASPVNYSVAGVPVTAPPVTTIPPNTTPIVIPEFPPAAGQTATVANAVAQQINLLTSFLDKFEIALQAQNDGIPEKDANRKDLVLEGEVCRP